MVWILKVERGCPSRPTKPNLAEEGRGLGGCIRRTRRLIVAMIGEVPSCLAGRPRYICYSALTIGRLVEIGESSVTLILGDSLHSGSLAFGYRNLGGRGESRDWG